MNDILAEFFNQFSPDEQAEIREAESDAGDVIAEGDAAVKERFRIGRFHDRDWTLAPQDAARAHAAGIEFLAYCNALWRRTDAGSPESIRVFLANLDKVVQGVLREYGQWESGGTIAECRRNAEQQAWLTNDRQSIIALVEDTASREETTKATVRTVVPGDAERTLANSEFWGKRQSEFEKYGSRFGSVAAHWKAQFGKWVLASEGGSQLLSGCVDMLNAIARKALPRIPATSVGGSTVPWQLWFSFMRSSGSHCEPQGSPIAISKPEWERMSESRKSLADVRTEFSRKEYEEFEKSKRSGKTLEGVRRELALSIGAEGVEAYRWLHDERIEQAFKASADFCFVLGSGEELPLSIPDDHGSDVASFPQQSPVSSDGLPSRERSTPASGEPRGGTVEHMLAAGAESRTSEDATTKTAKRRGRPTKFPDDIKLQALAAKGGKARAQILYQTNYPTPQQVKNVPSILKYFQRKPPT